MFPSTNPTKSYTMTTKQNIVCGYREPSSFTVKLSVYEHTSEGKDARPFISLSGFQGKTVWPPSELTEAKFIYRR